MRLGFFIESLNRKGGTEITLVNRINLLAQNYDYKIYILTKEDGTVFNLHQNISIKNIDSLSINELEKYLKNIKVEILTYINNYDFDYFNLLKISTKNILEYHTSKSFFEKIYYNTKSQNNILKKLVMKVFGYKKIRELEKVSNKFDKVVLLTKQDLKNWKLNNKIEISNSLREFPKDISKLENKIILSVGRLSKEKGFDRLIDVMKFVFIKHKDWTLEIYGDGPEKERLEYKINNLNLSTNIKIFSFEENILKKYLNSSIYILPSYVEGQGMVLLEAMSCGVPVVSFDIKCGPRDLIKNNFNGYIVRDNDIKGMSKKVIELIEKEDLRKEMGQKGRELSYLYKKDAVIKKWINLYKELSGGEPIEP
ncbi:MAG: glycosyltransferase [Cetobacterium sp.]|uniref:glycosyltransferase n=1 Tax=Cetobacterium sp. TaxID=2071632 RepID=UPI003F359DD3